MRFEDVRLGSGGWGITVQRNRTAGPALTVQLGVQMDGWTEYSYRIIRVGRRVELIDISNGWFVVVVVVMVDDGSSYRWEIRAALVGLGGDVWLGGRGGTIPCIFKLHQNRGVQM